MEQKRIILLKTTTEPELGHLYEHLFLTRVRRYLRTHHLYAHVDYTLQGWTYGKGIIYIDLSLYTPSALAELENILKFSLSKITDAELAIHLTQISTENHYDLGFESHSHIKTGLYELDSRPWETMDSLSFINRQGIHPESTLLTDGEPISVKSLKISLVNENGVLFKKKPELLPLFHQLGWLLMYNYIDLACEKYGLYSEGDEFTHQSDKVILTNRLLTAQIDQPLNTYAEIMIQLMAELEKNGAFARFLKQLKSTSYEQGILSNPDDDLVYQATGLFVGSQGWRQIATPENGNLVLENLLIEVRFGRKKVTAPLLPKGFIAALR